MKFETDGAEGEAGVTFAGIGVVDMLELEGLPVGVRGRWGSEGFGAIGEAEIEAGNFVEGDAGLAEGGHPGDQVFQGLADKEEGEKVAGEGGGGDVQKVGEEKEEGAEGKEEGEFAEVIDQRKPTKAKGLMVAELGGGGGIVFGEEGLAAIVVQLKFFGAIDEGTEVLEEVVLLVAAEFELVFGAAEDLVIQAEEEEDQGDDEKQDLPSQDQNVAEAADDHSEVDAEEGNDPDGVGEGLDVVGEGGEELGGAGLFEVGEVGGEDAAAQLEAEVVDCLLGQADQEELGGNASAEGDRAQADEAEDQGRTRRGAPLAQDDVD